MAGLECFLRPGRSRRSRNRQIWEQRIGLKHDAEIALRWWPPRDVRSGEVDEVDDRVSRPAMHRSSVVFPHPDGPRKQMNSLPRCRRLVSAENRRIACSAPTLRDSRHPHSSRSTTDCSPVLHADIANLKIARPVRSLQASKIQPILQARSTRHCIL